MTPRLKPDAHAMVVLLSGGLDSTVALAHVLQAGHPVAMTLTVQYGQRAWVRELAAVQALVAHYQVPNRVIELPWLAENLPEAMAARSLETDWSASATDVGSVWVPNRNGVFLNLAASVAEALGADAVVFGANAEEAADFPDNSAGFQQAMNASLRYSTLRGIRVEAPLMGMHKHQILRHALSLGVPLQHVWSCYTGHAVQCGQCPSCQRILAAKAQVTQAVGERMIPIAMAGPGSDWPT